MYRPYAPKIGGSSISIYTVNVLNISMLIMLKITRVLQLPLPCLWANWPNQCCHSSLTTSPGLRVIAFAAICSFVETPCLQDTATLLGTSKLIVRSKQSDMPAIELNLKHSALPMTVQQLCANRYKIRAQGLPDFWLLFYEPSDCIVSCIPWLHI